MKRALLILIAFSLGATGGIWAQAFLLPYLAITAPFSEWEFVQNWNSKTVIRREVTEIIINRDQAIERVIEQTEKSVVGIQSENAAVVIEGSGLILTTDGFIVTAARNIPAGYTAQVLLSDNSAVNADILKRDVEHDLALLKIEVNGLQTVRFGEADSMKLGTPVILIGRSFQEELAKVNQGIIRQEGGLVLQTNIIDGPIMDGAPLLNLEEELLGITIVDSSGSVSAIPISQVRSFSGF